MNKSLMRKLLIAAAGAVLAAPLPWLSAPVAHAYTMGQCSTDSGIDYTCVQNVCNQYRANDDGSFRQCVDAVEMPAKAPGYPTTMAPPPPPPQCGAGLFPPRPGAAPSQGYC
jgi:hypothetical protein